MKSIRARLLLALAILISVSVFGALASVVWTRTLRQQLSWIDELSLPLGKELTQLSTNLELLNREVERVFAVSSWGDENFRMRKLPEFAFNLVEADLTRLEQSDGTDRFRWNTFFSEARLRYVQVKVQIQAIANFLNRRDFDAAASAYPKLDSDFKGLLGFAESGRKRLDTQTKDALLLAPRQIATLELSMKVLLAVIVVVSLLVLWLGEKTIEPLRVLRRGVRSLISWNLDLRDRASLETLSLRAGDEAGELAKDFLEVLTALSEQERTLEFQNIRLEEQNRLIVRVHENERWAQLGRMSAQVAHDVGNPLHSIGLEAELALQSLDSERTDIHGARQSLRSILDSSERLKELVKHYLGMSRASVSTAGLFDPIQCIESVIATFSNAIQASQVRLDWTIAKETRAIRIRGDEKHFEQALANLVANAIAAAGDAENKTKSGFVQVSLSRAGADQISVQVEDSGKGVPSAMREKIFEPFITTKAQGTGLGLSFVKQVVQSMNGSIHVSESRLGGACFCWILQEEVVLNDAFSIDRG